MYQRNDRLGGTFRVQRYTKYRIYANKISKKKYTRGEIREVATINKTKKRVECLILKKVCQKTPQATNTIVTE